MARGTKKNKFVSILKTGFDITFYYKPNGTVDEPYCIVLNDLLRLRYKIVNGTIVIIDAHPMSIVVDMEKYYNKLIKLLISQSGCTILIDTFESTWVLNQVCQSMKIPIVEDMEFSSISQTMWDRYKDTYNDPIHCGFYLLSVVDDNDDEDMLEVNPIKVNNTSAIQILHDGLSKVVDTTVGTLSLIKANDYTCTIDFMGIKFKATVINNTIYITSMILGKNVDVTIVWKLIQALTAYISTHINVVMVHVTNDIMATVCAGYGFSKIHSSKLPSDLGGDLLLYSASYGNYEIIDPKCTNSE